ncbi:hypothetical protein DFP94_10589 [Fontibacillus phaseoli]|uniref:Uncharacterized protein n=1 Tax=Fontibacillus phaseoli TaxID=1416533 RepID=A0A369BC17_9BACL|nr:hypothetical protein [Fontibacillus phaseoli]RCX19073.1 hypothetical protein DFP94_10589 [Fontibacillus phaseoli]
MRVDVDNVNVKEIDNSIQSVNNWWMEVTSKIYKQDRFIYCVEINGQVFYNEYERVILDNFQTIESINIRTKTKQESITETLSNINEYLAGFLPASSKVADYFYGELSDNEWNQFSSFVSGLQWIIDAIRFLETLNVNSDMDLLVSNRTEIERIIAEMDQSLQKREYVMVGDLIQYELVPVLENYKLQIQE